MTSPPPRLVPPIALLAAAMLAGPATEAAPVSAAGATAPHPRQARTESTGAQDSPFEDLRWRAAAAREAGRLEDAVDLYQKALVLQPGWDEGRWYLATVLYELDRHHEARDLFAALVQGQPSHAGALAMKGLCEFQLGHDKQSLSDLLAAQELGVSRSPGIATVVRYHAAILLTRFGEFEIANRMLTAFAAEGQESPQVIEAFGLNVLRMPMLPSQITATMRERVTIAGRAGYALAARHVEAAKRALDDLLARYPGTPHAHYTRGVLLLTEDPDLAIEEFRRELAISPSHVPARLQLAFEYLKRGDAAQARTPAEEAVRLAPDRFASYLALGQVKLAGDDVEGAIADLEQAVRLAPVSPQARFLLARAYTRAGRTADAERARAEFARLDRLTRAGTQGERAVGGIPDAGRDPERHKEAPHLP